MPDDRTAADAHDHARLQLQGRNHGAEIMAQMQPFSDRRAKFVVPIPEPQVVGPAS
jgi:hypothetical protein